MSGHATIINLGAITADSIRPVGFGVPAITIPSVSTADTLATLDATQTLTNKTLTTPIIASLQKSASGGTINMPDVAFDDTTTLATIDTTQNISHKTFTNVSFIIPKDPNDPESETFELHLPMSLSQNSEIATRQYVNEALQSISGAAINTEKTRIDRLLNYLENWINVGNVSMSGITTAVNYGDCNIALTNTGISGNTRTLTINVIPSDVSISKITFYGDKGNTDITSFTTNDNTISFSVGDAVITSSTGITITLSDDTYVENVPADLFTTEGYVYTGTTISESGDRL